MSSTLFTKPTHRKVFVDRVIDVSRLMYQIHAAETML